MIKNYFKTAFRNLYKNKFYSLINIIGLSVGLAVGLLVVLWVLDEFSFDRYNHNVKNIYRVYANMGTENEKQIWSGVQAPLATWAKKDISLVHDAVRMQGNWDFTMFNYGNKAFIETNTVFVDPSIFTVFDIKWMRGNKATCFSSPNSVVITKSTSVKYFGTIDPIGKIILANKTINLIVTGVVEDFPQNSSIRHDMLFPMSLYANNFKGNGNWKTIEDDWGNYSFETYLLLDAKADEISVAKHLTEIHKRNQQGSTSTYILENLGKLHLYNADGTAPRFESVQLFVAVALFVFLIASINYINLSTARSMLRNKEVSVRKIIGASRKQLFFQFILETLLLFIMASILAFILIFILMPYYNGITGKSLFFNLLSGQLWVIIGLTLLLTLVAVSIYPALLLSSFKPIEALRGKISSGFGNAGVRKTLVVIQFVCSIVLIISTILIGRQLKYIHEKELGYDKEHVFTFSMGAEMQKHYQVVKTQLLKKSEISGVTSSGDNIIHFGNSTGDADWDGKNPRQSFIITQMSAEENFIKEFKIKLIAGENFKGLKADSSHFILNETAIKTAGIKNPIGKRFKFHGFNGTITGIVQDFHFASLKESIKPLILFYDPRQNSQIYIRTSASKAGAALQAAGAIWKSYNNNFPFECHFLDETFDELYKSDTRAGILFNVFATVAIFISCLGLFGLASFTAQVKTKEIGIRKVLGANISGIAYMLTRDFIKLVLIAVFIASPIAWLIMHNYLQEFAYRIKISIWVFIVSGLLAVLITVLTVSFQSLKAALANPVKSLRAD